ncbi:MAG: histidine--tRNA ligase [Rickettsia sp.]|nr:histidine--tRNA ligase [Rickettsia sp.]
MSNEIIQSVRGMRTLKGVNFNNFKNVIDISSRIAKEFNYQGIELPIVEHSEVFHKTLGDTSEIIEKEIYNFTDKGGKSLTLRPEFTAGIMREYIESKSYKTNTPYKYFSYGPAFRYNRPQTGRYRQFYQINFEHIGYQDDFFDAEIIHLAFSILKELKINNVTLELNSLGCKESRANYKNIISTYFQKYKQDLSLENQKKIDKNPIGILDSKQCSDQELIVNAPKIEESYTKSSYLYFDKIKKYLSLLNIDFKINPYLVRGLDYYSNIIFEFKTNISSQQNTLIGGGRYDDLATIMGHQSTPSVGCAGGIDRIANMINDQISILDPNSCVIIPISKEFNEISILLAKKLRDSKIKVMLDFMSDIGKQILRAANSNIKFAIFIGEEELRRNQYKVKNLITKEEERIPFHNIFAIFENNNK